MTTISQDIRGALQQAATAVSGFPAANQRAYEGGPQFAPTPGTPWARLQMMPTARRPIGLKRTGAKDNQGVFQVMLFGVPLQGSAAIEQLADRVVAAFEVDEPLIEGAARVQIVSARRGPTMTTPTDIQVPVLIEWRCLTAS